MSGSNSTVVWFTFYSTIISPHNSSYCIELSNALPDDLNLNFYHTHNRGVSVQIDKLTKNSLDKRFSICKNVEWGGFYDNFNFNLELSNST